MINICDIVLDVFTFGIWGALKAQRRMEADSKKLDADMMRIMAESQAIKLRLRKEAHNLDEGLGNIYR